MTGFKEEYEKWINGEAFDSQTKAELKNIKDEKEIEDRFYKNLSFGTGGLRGVIGAGTNRMNIYTVGKASQGLSDYINSATENGSVVIAYDSRRMSDKFAEESALVFAANGIKAYLFDSLRPTPELSFAVRYLKTTAGVEITASHNPPEYNGYKVYLSDGAQIIPPYDKLIIDKVNGITDFSSIKKIDKERAIKEGLLVKVGKETDDAYIAAVEKCVIDKEVIARYAKDIKIVYTPLNGTGKVPVLRVLKELGFENVYTVKEQSEPDGNFPTLKYPNPEDPAAFDLALKLAREVKADIVLATDPDADRLGVYSVTENGDYAAFNGNMSGLLLLEYELSRKKEKGLLPENPENGAIVSTIVSTDAAKSVAKEYGVTHFEVLTGFKYIGEKINVFEQAVKKNGGKFDAKKNAYEFLFGFEESYGCLIGTHARDKDAVVAVTALAEAAAYYKSKGLTLAGQMQKIYEKYGYYNEALFTETLAGADGAKKINAIAEKFRTEKIASLGGEKVVAIRDYKYSVRKDAKGKETVLDLPESNVIYFETESGWCAVRPSGTEPKIKFYIGMKGKTAKEAEEKTKRTERDLRRVMNEDIK